MYNSPVYGQHMSTGYGGLPAECFETHPVSQCMLEKASDEECTNIYLILDALLKADVFTRRRNFKLYGTAPYEGDTLLPPANDTLPPPENDRPLPPENDGGRR